MSRRNQPVIEEFDDDTDLPLPSRPLPNTGDKGAILQSIDSDDEDVSEPGEDVFARGWPKHPGPASPSNVGNPFGAAQQQPGAPLVTDLTPYKKYDHTIGNSNTGPGCCQLYSKKKIII